MRRSGRRGLLGALRHRDFRLLMVAFAVSGAGSWAFNVALTVYVFERTHSPTWAGAVTIGRFLPSVLFGSYGGVLAERFERVRLMLRLDLCCAALMGGLTALAALHGSPGVAIALGALTAVLSMAYLPAVTTITPQLVLEDDLAAANTVRSTIDNLVMIAGPALGALLLVAGTPAAAFAANGASFLVSALVLGRLSTQSVPVDVTEGGKTGPWRQMLVGFSTLRSSALASLLVAYSVIASFVYGTDTVLFVVVAERRLGAGADGYSYLITGLGVGGVLAAGLVNRIAAWSRLGPAILGGIALYCLPTLLLLVVHDIALAVAVEAVRGAGTLVVDVLAMTAMQRALPGQKLARVMGAYFAVALSAIALGALAAPLVLRATTLDATLWIAGGLIPLLCLLGWPALHKMDERNVVQLASIARRVGLLQAASLLASAPRGALERLAATSSELEVPAGTDVVVEGSEADALYIVEDGSMRVGARRGGDVERELAILGPGDFFGEIGLLEHIPRTATVTALSPSRLVRVEGATFLEVLVDDAASPTLLGLAESRLGRRLTRTSAPATPPGAPYPDLAEEPALPGAAPPTVAD